MFKRTDEHNLFEGKDRNAREKGRKWTPNLYLTLNQRQTDQKCSVGYSRFCQQLFLLTVEHGLIYG